MKSLDTEVNGLDLYHGSKPYFVTIGLDSGSQLYWEWDVDPETREPQIPPEDLEEIRDRLEEDPEEELILQNSKFDFQALDQVGEFRWPWERCHDLLLGDHILYSNSLHDLTIQALRYLRVDIRPPEDALRTATKEALRIAAAEFPTWKTAKAKSEDMPSIKESAWKADMWLPRRIAQEKGYPLDHPWWTVLSEYGNTDSWATLEIRRVQKELIASRKLERIYEERRKILPVVYRMEKDGVTINQNRLEELQVQYREESEKSGTVCMNIAKGYGYDLELPKSGNNNSLLHFCFGKPVYEEIPPRYTSEELAAVARGKRIKAKKPQKGPQIGVEKFLDLPVVAYTDSGNPSLNKQAIEQYEATLPEKSKPLAFVRNLRGKRKRDTALTYMEGYQRFWLPWIPVGPVDPLTGAGWYILHPSLNPTGTDTLRWSSSNPNEQNISKQEGFNLRYMFGPAPGREWWSCDAKNIELRLPAYEAGETDMIQLFERPNDPPYFGSYHLLVFDTLHPDKFKIHGKKSKDVYASTWYQWTKSGNFAVQYGAIESSGTADRAYKIPGAQRIIQGRFSKIAEFNRKQIRFAEKYGYVETIPDKTVDPLRGYPLVCTRTESGGILPTVPLNYRTQGSAMWWMMKAMLRCSAYLEDLNRKCKQRRYWITMQVHDELVFDFPKGTGSEPWKTNRGKIRDLMGLMEEGGNDIGIPTPVSCTYHEHTWSEGIGV